MNFHTLGKQKITLGWQLKEFTITGRKRGMRGGRGGACLLDEPLTDLLRSSPRRNPEGYSQQFFKSSFLSLSFPPNLLCGGFGTPDATTAGPAHAHGFRVLHPPSPGVTLLLLLNASWPYLQPYQAHLSPSICPPSNLVLLWNPLLL